MKKNNQILSLARKKSQDPKQEHLRQRKQDFNLEISKLISDLIEFKKGINGKGSSKLRINPGKIQEPLPSEVKSSLSVISNKTNKLYQEADSIIQEQSNYSQTRKKPKNASEDDMHDLNKNASWWGSRALSFFQFGDKTRTVRLQLMNNFTDVLDLLKNIKDDLNPAQEGYVIGSIDNFNNIYNIYFSNILINAKFLKEKDYKKQLEDLPSDISGESGGDIGSQESGQVKPKTPSDAPTGESGIGGEEVGAGAGVAGAGASKSKKTKPAQNDEEAAKAAEKIREEKRKTAMLEQIQFIFNDINTSLQALKPKITDNDKKTKIENIERQINKLFQTSTDVNQFDTFYEEVTNLYEEALSIAKYLVGDKDVNSFADILRFSKSAAKFDSIESIEIKKLAKYSLARADFDHQDHFIVLAGSKAEKIAVLKEKIKKIIDNILNQLENRGLNVNSFLLKISSLNQHLLELCNILYTIGMLSLQNLISNYNHFYQQATMARLSREREGDYDDLTSRLQMIKEAKDVLSSQIKHLQKINASLVAEQGLLPSSDR